MEGKRLVQTLRLKNFLSYGNEGKRIQLEPLNVLIGPNASGKSNFIKAISFLQETPTSGGLLSAVRGGGGVGEFLWKGGKDDPIAEIEATIDHPDGYHPEGSKSLRYKLSFTRVNQRLEIVDEAVENEQPMLGHDDVYFYYRYQNGHPVLNFRTNTGEKEERSLRREDLSPENSILSQRKDPDVYPEITYLGSAFSRIGFYKEWIFRDDRPPRAPLSADSSGDFLSAGGENLALVLNNLKRPIRQLILEKLKKFYDGVEDFETKIQGGTVQIYIYEGGLNESITAARLSDGTLRYLCLLAVLCHPNPPPLICIEEPETGLHPDVISTVAELLVDASKRTQLIITTHSDALVSALTEMPEAVLVCEHDRAGTHLRRLEAEKLKGWLEEYSLGDLWQIGEIGGTRW